MKKLILALTLSAFTVGAFAGEACCAKEKAVAKSAATCSDAAKSATTCTASAKSAATCSATAKAGCADKAAKAGASCTASKGKCCQVAKKVQSPKAAAQS